jgi:hypothetical protein
VLLLLTSDNLSNEAAMLAHILFWHSSGEDVFLMTARIPCRAVFTFFCMHVNLQGGKAAARSCVGRHTELPLLLHYVVHRLPAAWKVPKPVQGDVRPELQGARKSSPDALMTGWCWVQCFKIGGMVRRVRTDTSVSFKDLGKPWFHITPKSGDMRKWVIISILLCCPSPSPIWRMVYVSD